MRAALLFVLVLIGWAAVLAADGPDLITPFECGQDGGVILQVSLNGRGPFRFLLDTGSTHSAVSEAVASEIGAPIVARTVVGSVAGSRQALVARIDLLHVGPLVERGLLATVIDLDEVGSADGIHGVIGQDALTPLRYTIDFRQRRVLWWPDDGAVARRGMAFELEVLNGRFVVSLPQPGTVLRLVPDSGASSLLLFDGQQHLPLSLLPDRSRLTTMSGRASVQMAKVRELRVGAAVMRDVAAVVVGRDRSRPEPADGLLPLNLFDRVTFDGPRRRLILEGSALIPS